MPRNGVSILEEIVQWMTMHLNLIWIRRGVSVYCDEIVCRVRSRVAVACS